LAVVGSFLVSTKMEARKSFKYFLPGFLFLLLGGCDSNIEPDPSSIGIDHFPLAIGDFRVYQMETVKFTFSGDADTSVFQLKEAVVDSFENQEGGITFVLNRFSRDSSLDPWILDSAWSARKNNFQAILVENNEPFVKLTFPAQEDKLWNGNTLNSRGEDVYIMEDVFQEFTLDSPDSLDDLFDNTITVVQSDFDDKITRTDLRKEVYALNIGLIYKETTILSFCSDPNCLGQEIIESGRDLKQTLIDFGKE